MTIDEPPNLIDPVALAMAEELRAVHGAHTVILYGSRGRGEGSPSSDYDILGIAPVDRTHRDARLFRGHFLDAFIMPDARIEAPGPDLVYMHGGQVVFQRDQVGTRFLEALAGVHARGPAPLHEDDATMRRTWVFKMLARIESGDPEAHLRRSMLLTQVIEDFFALRGEWYDGPRRALARLESVAPDLYSDYVAALAPGADFATVARAARGFGNAGLPPT